MAEATIAKLEPGAFSDRVRDELERCSVGRDNPVHRMLLAGTMSVTMLRTLAVQQWAFHVAFPSYLAFLAGRSPDRWLRAKLLRDAYEQDREPGEQGLCAQWEQVCAVWGVTREALLAGTILDSTKAMLMTQECIAQRPFADAFAGLMIAVSGEVAPYLAARREAMATYYGINGASLAYFDNLVVSDPAAVITPWVDVVYRYSADRATQESALQAIHLVLRARWEYFSGIGRECGMMPE